MPTRSRTEPSRLESAGSRTESQWQLTDTQWFLIEDLFPDKAPNPKGGRPWRGNRECFEGVLFVLFTGCRWKDLPKHRFPSKSVRHSRFKEWATAGLFAEAWRRLLDLKRELGQLNPTRLLGDGTFVPAKKRGRCVGPTKAGKGSKVMLLTDTEGVPMGVTVTSASPHEVKLIEALLEANLANCNETKRLIYD